MRPELILSAMYDCVVTAPSSLLYASCIGIDDFPQVPMWSRRSSNWRTDEKLGEAIRNSRRAIKRNDLRRARYWTNVGEQWAKKR